MDEDKIQAGDVVTLRSGGNAMTVARVRTDDGIDVAHLVWRCADEMKEAWIDCAALDKVKS